ncbi:tripartite tricarboxylate transporter substrate binding protein [Nonomuraea sp. KC401]|uniref:Bug family tripartite tricarboxylate transporter substrate binding protein n=1 Tax=unclassified Nonomuraea TaxID=2593643 RepID=UPI0010FD6557|nr:MULTISPECIES: tripartite tricarboxylate transporter substrate binding protein [unclassified Nonomuraea]NBE96054.1 tripartite tricarboxylate transporter substrate binding protein [Nonomuraea sp. K271]TLF80258.1 tripartite tricarboxylate transporter substrate binding protein [Nonomuraea sp. KC401]
MRLRIFAALAALSLGALTGCGETSGTSASSPLRIMAPAAPGGGWDQTSRIAEQAIKAADPQRQVEVYNVPGAGGTIGLAQLAGEKGNGNLLMTMGLVMVGAIEQNKSKVTLAETTPIAKLTEEYEIVVVPAASPYKTLDDMVAAWKADPAKVSVSGGSAGGTDHIVAGLMAKAAGIDPKQVNYIAHSGGGEALNELLGNKVSAGISGVAEFAEHVKSGKLRALGVTSGERLPDLDAPTLKEAGLDVELANWRGFVAPAGLSDADKKALTDLVTKMHDAQPWKDAVAKNGWIDSFQTGQQFADYLASEQTRVKAIIAEMGLVS